MISFILTSRVKGNKDSNIGKLLDSVVGCVVDPSKVEFLIKYDTDDDGMPPKAFFERYPFKCRTFQWSRGEGRHSIHNDHMYLFAQHDPRARFVMIVSDDFTFNRKGFDQEILSIQDEYCFVGQQNLDLQKCSGKMFDPQVQPYWVNNGWAMCLPCFTVRTAEVLQNFGWQCNADNWQTAILIMMYEKYGINMWRQIPRYYDRNPSDGRSGFGLAYNNMEIDGEKFCQNPYYFKLVEQQVVNLRLNMDRRA
jgi:hypothetical protein